MQSLYPAFVHQADGSAFGVSFPDVPGCISAGDTLEEALSNAAEALAFHFEGLAESKLPIPAPSTWAAAQDVIKSDPELQADLVATFMVVTYPPEQVVRLSVSMPGDLVKRIDAVAGNYGRSGLIAEAVREKLANSAPRIGGRRLGRDANTGVLATALKAGKRRANKSK